MWPFKAKYSALDEAWLALKETTERAYEVAVRADSAAAAKVYDKASFDECLKKRALNWQVCHETVRPALERWERLILAESWHGDAFIDELLRPARHAEAKFRKDGK